MSDENTGEPGGESMPDGDAIAILIALAGPRPAVPAERAGRAKARVRLEWAREVRRRSRWRKARGVVILSAAAGLVLATGLAVQRFRLAPAPVPAPVGTLVMATGGVSLVVPASGTTASVVSVPATGAILPAASRLETDDHGRAALRLPGGSSVRLDFGTRVRLESRDALVLERGALYVDSGSAAGRGGALEIHTPMGVARDIGTQFEVRLEEASLRIRVRDGEVLLRGSRGSWSAAGGTELDLDSAGKVRRTAIAGNGPAWDWVMRIAPPFELEGKTLRSFLAWVSRETGFPIRFDREEAERRSATVILHGSIAGMAPDDALSAVLPTCGLTHRVENGVVLIGPPAGARKTK